LAENPNAHGRASTTLLVDTENSEHWDQWLHTVSDTADAPKVIAQSLQLEYLTDKTKEATLHMKGKRMKRLGYDMSHWFL
jgi:hypothetical protein